MHTSLVNYASPLNLRVAVVFGGRSAEHEVSVISARSVLAALDGIGGARTTLGAHPEGTTHVAFVIAQEFLAFEETQQAIVTSGTGDPFSPTFVMAALQHVALAHEGRVSTSRVNNGSRVCLTVPIDARRPN